MRLRAFIRSFAAVAVASLVAAACGSNQPQEGLKNTPQGPIKGGKIVLGAEQYPECINPITQCASASWLYWSVTDYVMPRAMEVTQAGTFTNSPLLTEAPSLDNGGLTQSPFTVRFKISPAAKWADGTPITSEDFKFTESAVLNTKGTYGVAGYDQISSIDTTDPHTAVLHYKGVYVDWPDVFGGSTGIILEKAAFPKEANQSKVDVSGEMQSSYPFSGGPWKLQAWSKTQTVLVRNDNYWGHKPNFDQVTIVPRTDPTTEVNDLLSGAIQAIFPQPGIVSLVKQFGTVPAVKFVSGPGVVFYESLWMNLSKPPFNDPKVRQALFYGVDRQQVINGLIRLNDPGTTTPLGCGMLAIPGTPWCSKTQPFAQFHYDTNMVAQILQGDGYTKGADGFWQKNGQPLAFEYATTQKDRRITTQALLKEKMVAAGFKVTTKVFDATLLFQTKLPHGDFQLADFALGGSPDPTITGQFGCAAIPTAANSYAGANDYHWCNQQADALMKQSDNELDQAKRVDELTQVYNLQAQDFAPGLPLYMLPQITAWRSDKIAGPIGTWTKTIYSGFWNIDQWYCVRAGACG